MLFACPTQMPQAQKGSRQTISSCVCYTRIFWKLSPPLCLHQSIEPFASRSSLRVRQARAINAPDWFPQATWQHAVEVAFRTERRGGHVMSVLWWILLAVIWIAIAFWPARVAGRKGHSFIGYFVFSLFFFPAALIVAYLVPPRALAVS